MATMTKLAAGGLPGLQWKMQLGFILLFDVFSGVRLRFTGECHTNVKDDDASEDEYELYFDNVTTVFGRGRCHR
jgi:hypothetical protein